MQPGADDPARGRLGRLVTFALLQKRVVLGGWSGVAHLGVVASLAVLFAGSIAVQIEGLILLPQGLRLGGVSFHRTLQASLEAAGLVLLAGSLVLLGRDLRRRDGPRTRTTARRLVLVALVVLAVSGFLIEGLRMSLRSDPLQGVLPAGRAVASAIEATGVGVPGRGVLYKGLWWLHVAVALGLVASAPFSPLAHALTASFNVWASRPHARAALDAPFDLRELVASGKFDVRVGLRTAGDLDTRGRLGLFACTECGRCDAVCPAHLTGTALSPRAMVQKLRTSLETAGPGGATDTPLLDGSLSAEEIWSCLMCGACVEACPVLVHPPDYVVGIRRDVAARGRLDGRRAQMVSDLARTGNPYGLPLGRRGDVAREIGAPAAADSAPFEWLYWLGCATVYDGRVREVARAMVEILRRAGLSFAVLGPEEGCCGDPARRVGEEGRFQELALANIAALERRGVHKIVTSCAHCWTALAHEYPRLGARFEVVDHTTLIDTLLRAGALGTATASVEPIALHDSCHLGRLSGVFDPPRRALQAGAGARLVELPRQKRASFCCGGGGAGYWFDVPRRERPASQRRQEACGAGARILAVACPFCLRMIEDAAPAGPSGDGLAILDVAEIVARRLAGGPGARDGDS